MMRHKMMILSIILVGIVGTMIFFQIYEKNDNVDINNSTNKTNETNNIAENKTIVPLERPPFIDEIEQIEK